MARTMDQERALNFRDQFRDARYGALADAEGYQKILFVLERFGSYLLGRQGDLGKYECPVRLFVKCYHPDAGCPPADHSIGFDTLYGLVREGRNDALHQGAAARILASHSIQLSIMLEDALIGTVVSCGDTIKNYMVRDPVCAYLWQPIGFIRQVMLERSFSYLPFRCEETWYVVSDWDIVGYLQICDRKKNCIKKILSRTLECARQCTEEYFHREVLVVAPNDAVSDVLPKCCGRPILVKRDGCEDLLGIVTPFDLL